MRELPADVCLDDEDLGRMGFEPMCAMRNQLSKLAP